MAFYKISTLKNRRNCDEKMGIQDVMPYEKVHIVVSTHKKKKGEMLEDFVGNEVEGRQRKEIDSFDGKAILSEPINLSVLGNVRLVIEKENWFYNISGRSDGGEDRQNFYNLAKDIVLSFELRE